MTKLKTLNDLEMPVGAYIGCSMGKTKVVDYEMLRAEAVKWIKNMQNRGDFHLSAYDWIKLFFNITEEELTK